MSEEQIKGIIEALIDLKDDSTVPRNVKQKIENTIGMLKEDTEESIKVNKALSEIEEVTEDANLEPFTRTAIWNIVSMLAKMD